MEEIIIDGVNISGCTAYKDKHCRDKTSIMFCDTNLCSNYPYCYYKQLKRLEQENKMLQELKDEDSLRVVQLAKENAELKERKDKYYQRTLDLEIVVSEYQQALEEIREITINTCNYNENCDGYACYSCQYIDEPSAIKRIQNKINEVLGNE